MVKFSKWVLVTIGSLLAFSCSTTKEITVGSNKVTLQTETSNSNLNTENQRVNTVSFASMVETPNQSDFQKTENVPLFKAIPDSVLEYVPTIAEERTSLEEERVGELLISDPPVKDSKEANFYARTSLTLGLIGFFTAISFYGPIICGTLAIVYARKSRLAKEPDQKKARAGKFWGIASFVAIPLAYIAIAVLEIYL